MTCGSHLLDTWEMVDDESYLRHINNISNPGLAQQYTYSTLGVTNSPYKRRGPPRGASLLLRNSAVISLLLRDSAVIRLLLRDSAVIRLLLRDSAVISDFSFGIWHSIFDIRYSAFGTQQSSVKLHLRNCEFAIRVRVTRPELPHPSANFPGSPEPNDFDC